MNNACQHKRYTYQLVEKLGWCAKFCVDCGEKLSEDRPVGNYLGRWSGPPRKES